MPVCPNCGNQTAENAVFCDQCGTRIPVVEPEPEATVIETPASGIPEGVLICPDCGAENVPGEVFCDVCGNPLEAPEPVSAVEAAPAPSASAETIYCPTCGAEVAAGDTFCANCGAAVGGADAVPEEVEPDFGEDAAELALEAEVVVEDEVPPEAETLVEEEVVEVEIEEVPVDEEVSIDEEVIEEVEIEEIPVEETIEELVIEETPVDEAETIVEELVIEEEPLPEIVEEIVVEEVEPAEDEGNCPVCGASTVADQAFCASCGAALTGAAPEAPASAPVEPPVPVAPSGTGGLYLEVSASGAQIPLVEQPELLIGREDQVSGIHPEIDMTPHGGEEGGVSRRHAKLILDGGVWFLMDLDSTNGTYLNGVELQPRIRSEVRDGDSFSLGDVELVFHA